MVTVTVTYRAEVGLNFDGRVIREGRGMPQLIAQTSTKTDANLIVAAFDALDSIAAVLDRDIEDRRKVATVTRLVNSTRLEALDGRG